MMRQVKKFCGQRARRGRYAPGASGSAAVLSLLLAAVLSLLPLPAPALRTLPFLQPQTVLAEEYADDYSDDSADGYADDAGGEASSEEEEEPFIPEEYYEPVQSNDLAGWPQGQAIQAAAGVVMDLDTNALLYSKNAFRELYPASITKIMTCMLVLEHVSDLDAVMTCSSVVYELEENASATGLQPGEELTVRDALYALMLQSANDAANALAEYVGGSIAGFADMMNEKAAALGCAHTHFVNPSGLHSDDHYTCAADMALIAQAAYEMPMFRRLVSTTQAQVDETNMTDEIRYYANHHKMIQESSDYYQSWCTGGKTGFTSDAWNTLVTYGEKDGKRLVCVLLHGNGAAQNYLETTDLMNYGFDNFTHVDLSEEPYRWLSGVGTQESRNLAVGGTLAYALGLGVLGEFQRYLPEEAMSTTAQVRMNPVVTLPCGADTSLLTMVPGSTVAGDAYVTYKYDDWRVGAGSLKASAPETAALTAWHAEAREKALWVPETESELSLSDQAWSQAEEAVGTLLEKGEAFYEENSVTVILSAIVIGAVLLMILIIAILRGTRQSRLRRRRETAEREALRREEEIEAKSAAEIEQELREAMRIEEERKAAQAQIEKAVADMTRAEGTFDEGKLMPPGKAAGDAADPAGSGDIGSEENEV